MTVDVDPVPECMMCEHEHSAVWEAGHLKAIGPCHCGCLLRTYPEYPEVDPDEDPVTASAWKTDPMYWQADLDHSYADYRETERQRYAWLAEWEKRPIPRGDMMTEVEYLRLRVNGECSKTSVLASLLTLHELGCPEPTPDLR